MEDILAIISECEKKAENIIEEAKKESSQIILEAQKLAQDKKEELFKESNLFAEKFVEEKKVLGQFENKRILTEASEKIKEIEMHAEENMNKAVMLILKLV
jgi:vacuolar-type H+-ATPase subunit H